MPDGLHKDGWVHELGPLEWSSEAGASLDSQAFWKIFHDCSSKLPKNISAVFTMREVDGVESKEICTSLNISENNLWVMLHRARMALRRCLETNWLGTGHENQPSVRRTPMASMQFLSKDYWLR